MLLYFRSKFTCIGIVEDKFGTLNLLYFSPSGNPELAALIVLTALLPDSRARVDTGRVMHLDQVSIIMCSV